MCRNFFKTPSCYIHSLHREVVLGSDKVNSCWAVTWQIHVERWCGELVLGDDMANSHWVMTQQTHIGWWHGELALGSDMVNLHWVMTQCTCIRWWHGELMVGGDTADSLGPNAAFSSVAGAGKGSKEVAHLARSPILWGSLLFPMPPSNPPYWTFRNMKENGLHPSLERRGQLPGGSCRWCEGG